MRVVSALDAYHLSAIALLRLAGMVPSQRAHEWLARALGRLAYTVSRDKRRRSETSVARAFGPNDPRNPTIVAAGFREFWTEMLTWTTPPAPADIVGLEHLARARAAGRGAILWESHGYGPRLIINQTLHARGFTVRQIHGPDSLGHFLVDAASRTWVRDAIVRKLFDRLERRFVAEIIYLPATDELAFARALLMHLRQNALLCITGDGPIGRRMLPMPFLGHTVGFSAGMVTLARLSGAPLLPVWCVVPRRNARRVVIGPPIAIDATAERDTALRGALAQYVTQLEELVRRDPEHYRSWHRLTDWRDGDAPRSV